MTNKDDLIKVTEEPHILSVAMTEDEKKYDQEQLLQTLSRIEDLDLERKAVLADFKARTEKLKETYNDLMMRLKTGKAMRSLMCTLTLNYSTLEAQLRLKETNELIQSRPMSQLERNMDATPELPFDEGDPDPTVDADAQPAEASSPEPTEEEGTNAEPVEDGTENPTETPAAPDATDLDAEAIIRTMRATSGQRPENGSDEPEHSVPSTGIEDANAHAEEKFGSDPTADGAGTTTPESTAPPEPDPDDAQADADLAMWMGLDA